jgi:hypothetical protein
MARDASDRVDRPNGVKKLKNDKLFQQRKMKKVLTESEHPDFEIESVFDLNYKEGKEIKMAKKKKDKGTDKLAMSFSSKNGKKGNNTYYKYEPY